jgi:hypothetical protein
VVIQCHAVSRKTWEEETVLIQCHAVSRKTWEEETVLLQYDSRETATRKDDEIRNMTRVIETRILETASTGKIVSLMPQRDVVGTSGR